MENKYEIRSDEYNSLLRKVPKMFVFWGNIFVVLFLVIIAFTLNVIPINDNNSLLIKIEKLTDQGDSSLGVGSLTRKEGLEILKDYKSKITLNKLGHGSTSTDIQGTIKAVDTVKNLVFISFKGIKSPSIGTVYNLKFKAAKKSFFAIVRRNLNKK